MRDRSMTPVAIRRYVDGAPSDERDLVASEEPMEIRAVTPEATHSVAITMRTPGHDFELAMGFLLAEGLIAGRDDVVDVSYCPDPDDVQQFNIVNVTLAPEAAFDASLLSRNFYATSSCGVCGKASLEALRTFGAATVGISPQIKANVIQQLPDTLRGAQAVFQQTGGLHATGLFTPDGDLLTMREDVGRHNALDKVVGHHAMAGDLPLSQHVAVVSGRASWELMQKALAAGIAVVVAVGAPSSLAVELAQEFGLTLIGFTKQDRFNVYAGSHRVVG
jgi:FdhD protein